MSVGIVFRTRERKVSRFGNALAVMKSAGRKVVLSDESNQSEQENEERGLQTWCALALDSCLHCSTETPDLPKDILNSLVLSARLQTPSFPPPPRPKSTDTLAPAGQSAPEPHEQIKQEYHHHNQECHQFHILPPHLPPQAPAPNPEIIGRASQPVGFINQ